MFSFMTAIKIILLIVLTPKRIINPIPAEIPKIVWVAHSEINLPIKAYGIVLAAISVSFTVPKLKYNKNKINNKTAGTMTISCLLARSLLSNSPAQTRSEERRVGKECRFRWMVHHVSENGSWVDESVELEGDR